MRIKSRFNSISFKLTVFYIGSVLLVVTIFIVFTSIYSSEVALAEAQRTMEAGPGFLNSLTPEEATALPDTDDINIGDVVSEYSPFGDVTARGEVDDNGYLLYLTITNKETGPVTLYPEHFPATLLLRTSSLGDRSLFYKEVTSYDDVLVIASVDTRSLYAINSSGQIISNVLLFSMFIIALTVFFGWFVSQKTVK